MCFYSDFTAKNLQLQRIVIFELKNALKLTYEHLKFQHFFPGMIPPDPLKAEGGEERRERQEGEGRKVGTVGNEGDGKGKSEWTPPFQNSWIRP